MKPLLALLVVVVALAANSYMRIAILVASVSSTNISPSSSSSSSSLSSSSSCFRVGLVADPQIEGDARAWREGTYGALNNDFNDALLGFVARRLAAAWSPHVSLLLGDLVSSQFIDDGEFEARRRRLVAALAPLEPHAAVAGNHDVGYGGEPSAARRLVRFEAAFGESNRVIDLGARHVAVLVDAMHLEHDVVATTRHAQTWAHVEAAARVARARNASVVLVTHIPLDKPAHSCRGDAVPHRSLSSHGAPRRLLSHTHASASVTRRLLTTLEPVLVLSGHDHEGCRHVHARDDDGGGDVLEVTLRATQGDYGASVGLMSVCEHERTPIVVEVQFLTTKQIMAFVFALIAATIVAIIC